MTVTAVWEQMWPMSPSIMFYHLFGCLYLMPYGGGGEGRASGNALIEIQQRKKEMVMAGHFNSTLIPKRALKYFEANRNVLVIEDDKVLGQMVTEILDDVGFEVSTAPNGRVAFEKLQKNSIDFIVLDILLPEMDGFEIYAKLQANPDTKDIPVMLVTAWADERNIERASQMGIQHFLPKPFTEDELLYTILTLLVDSSRKESR
jgi:CheY-like chemotaxis protein